MLKLTQKTSNIKSHIHKNTSQTNLKSVPNPSLGPSLEHFYKKLSFSLQFSSQRKPHGSPEGAQKSLKIIKNRKKRVLKKHLKSVPQKTSKINVFGSPQNLPDRAETRARASFSLIHPLTKKSSKLIKKAPIWSPWDHQNHKKCEKVTSRKTPKK